MSLLRNVATYRMTDYCAGAGATFTKILDVEEGVECPARLVMSAVQYADFGQPIQVTVTIQPGDHLNDDDPKPATSAKRDVKEYPAPRPEQRVAILAGYIREAQEWARRQGLLRREWVYVSRDPRSTVGLKPTRIVELPDFRLRPIDEKNRIRRVAAMLGAKQGVQLERVEP